MNGESHRANNNKKKIIISHDPSAFEPQVMFYAYMYANNRSTI